MFFEPVRRAAMIRTRDMGEVSMSGRVTLVQETDQNNQPVCPDGISPNSLNERKDAIQGYVYVTFRINDLVQGLFPEIDHMIDFKLYDGPDI